MDGGSCMHRSHALFAHCFNQWMAVQKHKRKWAKKTKKNTPRIVYILCALRCHCHCHSLLMHRAFHFCVRQNRTSAVVASVRVCVCVSACVWVCLSAHSRRTPTSALNATCALSKRQKGASSFVSIIYELQTRHCTEHCEKKTNKPGFIAQDMPERNDVTCCWVRKQFETKNYSVMEAEKKKTQNNSSTVMEIFIIMIMTWQNVCSLQRKALELIACRVATMSSRRVHLPKTINTVVFHAMGAFVFNPVRFFSCSLFVSVCVRATFISNDMCSFQFTVVFIISIWMKGCQRAK